MGHVPITGHMCPILGLYTKYWDALPNTGTLCLILSLCVQFLCQILFFFFQILGPCVKYWVLCYLLRHRAKYWGSVPNTEPLCQILTLVQKTGALCQRLGPCAKSWALGQILGPNAKYWGYVPTNLDQCLILRPVPSIRPLAK